ncbi:MAG: succinate dehydrogenase cytochrome b subunit [Candidatus Melainabacteria bacterium]|jgi:succinate dehydrogenase / fumarate reductase, cytochrome b subunit|nr:succinate dehydrogenase cytochrome b subunit [Candidatus Melainabacteria bacterium]MBX9673644.1 succinate dehydrogenase cytochrome b subunit [Candidatus Obscuribacterales bacterium]
MQNSQSQGVSVRRISVASNPIIAFWQTVVGKKIVMAVTGLVLIGFVIGHVAGNLKIFIGPEAINAYSRFLREVGQPELEYEQVLWIVRSVLLACVALHVTAAVQLSKLSLGARPVDYKEKKNLATNMSAMTMRIGGLFLFGYIVFHVLHLTLGKVGYDPGEFHHLSVYQNVVNAFHHQPIAIFYIIAMGALFLHLDHGIWSMLQTLGFSNRKNQATLKGIGRLIAFLIFAGFISVPVAVMTGVIH